MTEDAFFYSYKQQALQQQAHIFLESGRDGAMHIAGLNPLATIRATETGIHIVWRDGRAESRTGESLALVETLVDEYHCEKREDLPLFQGGAIGFISYDYARAIEKLPLQTENDLQTPTLYFYLFDEWAVYDKATQQAYVMALAPLTNQQATWEQAAILGLQTRRFTKEAASDVVLDDSDLQVSFSKEDFAQAVKQVQAYIAAGDVFQVNLSVRQSRPLQVAPIIMYEALRAINPSPYMAFIQAEDFAVVSGSPELLIERNDKIVETRPIGGTRPRGMTAEQDAQYEQELRGDVKECAEHVMLVDLERNDLGRIAKYGTVEVNELMVVERYSHVMHLVSNVRAQVAEDKTNTDVLRAMFPGGTITGAPKVRTMEIIEELEPVQRGLYTGSIGWLGFTGDMVFNIVIRTAYVKDGMAHIQAGAGLVIDSNPESEYVESLNKAKAMWQAKAVAEEQR
ncbi:MAG TPA: anthranilate synthase component I family protein [Metalysinibacillus sp.]